MTDDASPAASTWMEYERPLADVRALFFDVDVAVREKIHRGMRLQWLPRKAGGEARLRRTTRVLDKLLVEEVVIEEGPDGAWVQRFVEGQNAGTRFVGHFEEAGAERTNVRLEAFVGPHGFAQGLGKLSSLGLEKALQRVLGEYKQALEDYEPGRARGAVLAALADAPRWGQAIRALEEAQRRRILSTLLETAWSIACVADGPDPAERDAMRAIVAALWGTALDPATEEKMVRAAVDAVSKQGAQARCTVLGERLRALGYAEIGVTLAAVVAEVSRGIDPTELEALSALASAAGIDDGTLREVLRRTDSALGGPESMGRMSRLV